jgi:hypothetical protein
MQFMMQSLSILLQILVAPSALAFEMSPKLFVDKGACPFECCTYREWSVSKDTDLLDSVEGRKLLGKAAAHSSVTAVTGEVHVIPGKIVVISDHGLYKAGDAIDVLTYQGEGSYKFRYKGKVIFDSELDAIATGQSSRDKRWANFASEPQSTWWVQIKLPSGKTGWTKEAANFGKKDSCGR